MKIFSSNLVTMRTAILTSYLGSKSLISSDKREKSEKILETKPAQLSGQDGSSCKSVTIKKLKMTFSFGFLALKYFLVANCKNHIARHNHVFCGARYFYFYFYGCSHQTVFT